LEVCAGLAAGKQIWLLPKAGGPAVEGGLRTGWEG
jgi:hypothetical protein